MLLALDLFSKVSLSPLDSNERLLVPSSLRVMSLQLSPRKEIRGKYAQLLTFIETRSLDVKPKDS